MGDDSVVQNYNLSLECNVEGNPLPEVLWFKDDQPLYSSRKFRIRTRVRKQRRRKVRYGRDIQDPELERGRRILLRKKLRARRAEAARRLQLVVEERRRLGLLEEGGGGMTNEPPAPIETRRRKRIQGLGGGRRRNRGERRNERRHKAKERRLRVEYDDDDDDDNGDSSSSSRRRLDRTGRGYERDSTSTGRARRQQQQQQRGTTRKTGSRRRQSRRGRRQGRRDYSRRRTTSTSTTTTTTTTSTTTTQPDTTTTHHRRRHQKSRGGNNRKVGNSNSNTNTNTTPSTNTNTRGSRGTPDGRRRRQQRPSPQRRVLVSSLVVRNAAEEDAGIYKCVARSVVGEAHAVATIRVVPPIDPHPYVDKCPYDGYCLNGGTCMMFKIVGELVCQCAEGFKGQRCTEKEVYPTFNRNCHGPIRNRHSQGRRCPRNQPAALWELLQQTLASRHEVSPRTRTQLLSWSPSHTGNIFWLQNLRPNPHSPPPPLYPTPHSPPPSLPHLQDPSASGQDTTLSPTLLDSLYPSHDPSQVPHHRGPILRQTSWPTNPLYPSQLPYSNPPQPTSRNSLVQRTDIEPWSTRDPTFNTSVLSPPRHVVGESPEHSLRRNNNSTRLYHPTTLHHRHHTTSTHHHRHHHGHHSQGTPRHSTTMNLSSHVGALKVKALCDVVECSSSKRRMNVGKGSYVGVVAASSHHVNNSNTQLYLGNCTVLLVTLQERRKLPPLFHGNDAGMHQVDLIGGGVVVLAAKEVQQLPMRWITSQQVELSTCTEPARGGTRAQEGQGTCVKTKMSALDQDSPWQLFGEVVALWKLGAICHTLTKR
ncbi:hypothetical protein Pmani_035481 [Petrolisthes manimaculis]|uniref:Uncharacterized protein n=1 Tax=Petrolisthes manimaculis TaxID=1843537 RepID=A0AAE1NKG7_9EUCA|nr:hypothetical protein Pmani_035481 [Petrolisthes manimaculis]